MAFPKFTSLGSKNALVMLKVKQNVKVRRRFMMILMSQIEVSDWRLKKDLAGFLKVSAKIRLACSVHPNLGNRDFIHASVQLQLNVSNPNPNLGNLQANYEWQNHHNLHNKKNDRQVNEWWMSFIITFLKSKLTTFMYCHHNHHN